MKWMRNFIRAVLQNGMLGSIGSSNYNDTKALLTVPRYCFDETVIIACDVKTLLKIVNRNRVNRVRIHSSNIDEASEIKIDISAVDDTGARACRVYGAHCRILIRNQRMLPILYAFWLAHQT